MTDSFWAGNIESIAFIGGYLQESPEEIYQRFNRASATLTEAHRNLGTSVSAAAHAFETFQQTLEVLSKRAGSTKNRKPSRRHYRKRYV